MQSLRQQVLRTDAAGMPLEWISYQDAARLYHAQQVAYTCGELLYVVHGGVNALSGRQSMIEVNSIIATHGSNHSLHERYIPPLNNTHSVFFGVDLMCGNVLMAKLGGKPNQYAHGKSQYDLHHWEKNRIGKYGIDVCVPVPLVDGIKFFHFPFLGSKCLDDLHTGNMFLNKCVEGCNGIPDCDKRLVYAFFEQVSCNN